MTQPAERPESRRPGGALLAFLLVVTALSAAFRIEEALTDPNVRGRPASALLVTDPALIAHYTQELVENGGWPPADWSADRSIEHPRAVDAWSMFTFGQEFLVAWAQLATGERFPLHGVAIWVMGLVASLTAAAVGLVAWELTQSRPAAATAAALWVALPVAYRTVGFCFIREDLALPLYALHLYFLARAARVRTRPALALAGASAALALATWHALGAVLLVELTALVAWFLRTGANPLRVPGAWLAPASAAILGLLVPILRTKLFVLSAPMCLAASLLAAALWARRRALGRWAELGVFGAALALSAGAASGVSAWTGGGARDYAHVVELLVAKLRYGGTMPSDPGALSFGARLLWQGPFSTAPWASYLERLGPGLLGFALALALGAGTWLRGRGDGRTAVLLAFTAAALVLAKLIVRLEVLCGLLLPVTLAVAIGRLRSRPLAASVGLASVAGAVVATWLLIAVPPIAWYRVPVAGHPELDPLRLDARTELMDWLGAHVPPGEAIASDFLTSAAILAHTGHPIIQQPKYETLASRERIEAFFDRFYRGGMGEFYAYMRELDCRYLVVNDLLMRGNAWLGGIPTGQAPEPGTPARYFLHPDARMRRNIRGARQIHRTPKELWFEPLGIQWFQVYDLRPEDPPH